MEAFILTFNERNWQIAWLLLGVIAFFGSLYTAAPYGRHFRKGWGPSLPNRWGWIIMELPALLFVPILFYLSGTDETVDLILVGLWVLHYGHRTLIFPFVLNTSGKVMPLSIVAMAIIFNCINGCFVSTVFYLDTPIELPFLIVGLSVFLTGMFFNMRSDYYLIGLRKASDDYVLPTKRLFKYVSCPNHMSEILEWIGFALISVTAGPWLFAFWTAANLLPRALSHHKWYKEHFPDYPADRKAIFPFLL